MTQQTNYRAGVRTRGGAGIASRGLIAVAAATALSITVGVQADDVVRNATAGSLNVGTSWSTGNVPTTTDVAVWQNGSAATGTIGGDVSFGGIKIVDPASVTISATTGFGLTIGASGIDMSAATANLTVQPGTVTLGAAQTWNVASGRTLTMGNSSTTVTGASTATITKTGAGTLVMNTALSTFSGGIILNGGVLAFNTVSVVGTGGVVTNGPFGTGTLTINGGTLSTTTTSGRDFANDVIVNSDFTIGTATGTGRVRAAGTWDLGGQTRNITLNGVGTGINNSSEGFGFLGQGTAPDNKVFKLANGTMRFVASASATAAAPSTVAFAQGSGGVNFANNSGVTLGANVLAFLGSSQTMSGTNAPKLTLESGSTLYLASNSQAKSFTANSISGSGLIASGIADALTPSTNSTLTIDGATGSANFSGTIQDNITIFGITGGAKTNVAKTGGNTQTFSGTNTYTGTTSVTGGTLVVGAAQAIPQASATTVGGGAGVATIQLGTTAQTTLDSLTIASNGRVDLNKGQLLLNNGGGATALANFAAQVTTGRSGGSGVFSSSADGNHDIGFKDTGTGIYARYTLLGDADLSGSVNFNDFLTLQANFGQAGTFNTGDFNYDGVVNFNDFLALQANFGQSVSGAAVAVTASQVAAMQAFAQSVPEPASLALLGLGAAGVLRRRRRA